ncbi:hypothetical protein [Actinomyces viscosus]|uniref:hypothetical protein n=1 Tax=Actinomyces viscosus TaxID=1656 RepID=UPI0013DF0EE5|nr:hypothetical protein [Actinomyces viscosus]
MVSELQSTLSQLQKSLPGLATNLSSANTSVQQSDRDSASRTPKSSSGSSSRF